MATSDSPFPSFRQPPVIEVVCGVTFKAIDALLVPHIGLLWEKFRQEYPECKEVDPLIPVIESLQPAETPQSVSIPTLPRVWFLKKDGTGIIQIQRDRFLYNWRKVRPTDEYPRFNVVVEEFVKHFETFRGFLNNNQLGAILPEQFEITYLNHIPAGQVWESLVDIGKVFPDFCWRPAPRVMPSPEIINWRTTFPIPNKLGRLHVSIQSAKRKRDSVPIIVMDLTARGISRERTIDSMRIWMNEARELIVKGFVDLTSGALQQDTWSRTA